MPTFAVLIDVENIRAKSLNLSQLVEHFSALGQIAVCRAVACSGQFSGLQKQLDVAGFEKIEYPRHARNRNRADIHIVIDAVELLWTRPDIDSFVLVSGDSDFVPLIRKLQSFQRRTIVLGNAESTAKTLKAACDEFLNIEGFTRKPGEAAAAQPPSFLMRACRPCTGPPYCWRVSKVNSQLPIWFTTWTSNSR